MTGIDSLRNVLELECRKGYIDKAVIGGLDKYLHKQAGQIRQSIGNRQLLGGFDEPIDEGVVTEQMYARMTDKPVIGWRTDVRAPY